MVRTVDAQTVFIAGAAAASTGVAYLQYWSGRRWRASYISPGPGYDPDKLDEELSHVEFSQDLLKEIVPRFESAARLAPTPALSMALELPLTQSEAFIVGAADSTETRLNPLIADVFQHDLRKLRNAFRTLDKPQAYYWLARTFHTLTCSGIDNLKPASEGDFKQLREAGSMMRKEEDYHALAEFHRTHGLVGWSDPLTDYSFDTIGLLDYRLKYREKLEKEDLQAFSRDAGPFVVGLADSLASQDQRRVGYNLDAILGIGAYHADK